MKRVEIIINQALEMDVVEALEALGYGENFTFFFHVGGRGTQGRREGSSIWPEENILFLIFMKDSEALEMLNRVKDIKDKFPSEGTHCYVSEGPIEYI